MDTMLTYNTNSKTGPVCGGRARHGFSIMHPLKNIIIIPIAIMFSVVYLILMILELLY